MAAARSAPNNPATLLTRRSNLTVGLLGGSFNPAHEGHLHISLEALKRLKLDQVWWLVSPQNPLKPKAELAEFDVRLEYARDLAAHPRIKVLDFEQHYRLRYSYDTVRLLQRRYPGIRFVWLMGADNLAQFHRWRKWKLLFKLLPVAILDRAPFSHVAVRMLAATRFANRRLPATTAGTLANATPPGWIYLHIPRHAGSATQLRKKLGKKAFLGHNKIVG